MHYFYEEPQIVLRGNREISVSGCLGIAEYEPESVKLQLPGYNLRINGRNLTLQNMNPYTVVLSGTFTDLDFTG